MTGPNGSEPAPEPAPVKPAIVITFVGPGQAAAAVTFEGDPQTAQVYAAAWLLEAIARELRAQQVVGSMARGIIAAHPGQVPGLRSLGQD